MKKYTLISLFVLISCASRAQTGSDFMTHHWYGFFTENSSLFEGDSYSMKYELYNINYDNSTNTFSGTMYGTINIDNSNYSSTWAVTGSLSTDYSVSLNYNYVINEDALPEGLQWIYENLSGTLYEDQDRSGEYLIKGYKSSTNGEFELSTYPN